MTELMIPAMKVARKRLPAHRTGMGRSLRLCCSSNEPLGQVSHLEMERSCVSLQILRVGESFNSEAVCYFALERPCVDVDVSVACLLILETLREVSACNSRAFEPPFHVEKFVIRVFLVCSWARLGLGKYLKSLAIPVQGFREVIDADLVLCVEAFLLESVDVAGELY